MSSAAAVLTPANEKLDPALLEGERGDPVLEAKTGDYRQMKKRIDSEGIRVPFPQRDVHLYQHQA